MHIMEGYLPVGHAAAWTAISAVFVGVGVKRIRNLVTDDPRSRWLLAISGAFIMVLSALKMPSVTGSCSHPTGTGLGAILFGPTIMSVLGMIVLLFQALLLAHGGMTTLGANTFSMAVVGPYVAYGFYHLGLKSGLAQNIAIFVAAALGNLATYITTSIQLALAFPDAVSGFSGALAKFLSIFAFTQIPLALTEAMLTIVVINVLKQHAKQDLRFLNFFPLEKKS